MDAAPDLRFPIGPFDLRTPVDPAEAPAAIEEIAAAPAQLRAAVAELSDEQLDTPYRPGGWTVRQVVHHLPDSHLNAYTRFRLALTEDEPTIRPYYEARWAELVDARTLAIEPSLRLLEALHERWVVLLRAMTPQDFTRGFYHPEAGCRVALATSVASYAWHGRHHTAHVTELRRRMGW